MQHDEEVAEVGNRKRVQKGLGSESQVVVQQKEDLVLVLFDVLKVNRGDFFEELVRADVESNENGDGRLLLPTSPDLLVQMQECLDKGIQHNDMHRPCSIYHSWIALVRLPEASFRIIS